MNRILLLLCFLLLRYGLEAQIDTIPPDINCPQTDTVTLSPGGTCSFQYFFAVVSSDNEPGDTLVQLSGLESGADFPLGNTVNVFQAVDAAGNTATCSFTLTVQNYAGPLVCKSNINVSMDSSCTWTARASDLLDGNVGCTDSAYYVLEVDKNFPYGNGPWVPMVFGPGDLGKNFAFRVQDTIFGYNCTGNIQVNDQLPPVLTCKDFTISCAVDNVAPYFLSDSLGFSEAQPLATDGCGEVMLTHVDITVDSGCTSGYVGAINRKWTAQDNFGNISTCIQQILLTRPVIGDLKYPPDISIDCANPDISPLQTGLPYLEFAGRKWINTCSLGTAFNDTTLQLCPGISQVVRTWFVIDWCNGDALEKVQNITLNDATGPAFLDCPANVTVSAATNNCVAEVDLPDFVIADACSYATEISAFWIIDSVPGLLAGMLSDFPGNDTTKSDTLAVLGSIPGVPPGIHVIRYTAMDACGSTSTCEFNLHVWDSLPPVAACLPYTGVALNADGTASVSSAVFDNGSSDDCGNLAFKVNRLEAGDCAPDSVFDDQATFCCADLADTVRIVLRVYDVPVPAGPVAPDFAAGQYTDCQIAVAVTDGFGVCNPTDSLTVSGLISAHNAIRVVNVDVQLEVNPGIPGPVFHTLTDTDGKYAFSTKLLPGDTFRITPYKNAFHLDGVSTFDLVLISKHILALESLDSPYKMIAADANRSKTITTFDVVEIRKLILGIYDSLPNNTSWRFIDAGFVFPDPFNPFLFPFPESITVSDSIPPAVVFDFIGVKTGDVNHTAIGDPLSSPADDRYAETLFFNAKNREVAAGEAFTVHFETAEKTAGYQFTLNTGELEVLEIQPGHGMSVANFAVFPGAVTASVDLPETSEASGFSVRFRSRQAGRLSDWLGISSRITTAEAYLPEGKTYQRSGVALRFDDGTAPASTFQLFQNQPNPFNGTTRIGFVLPEDAETTFSIFNQDGRLLHRQQTWYESGYHEILFDPTPSGASGILYYQLETPAHCAVRKMVLAGK